MNETDPTGKVLLTVVRSNGGIGSVSVPYTVNAGTATAGLDYTAAAGTLTFADGELSKTIAVSIINDTLVENPETFTVILGQPASAGATLGSIATATVTIISDDTTPPAPKVSGVTTTVSKGSMTAIKVTFSTDLDPNSIKNLASYTLAAAGKDGKFGTKDDTKYKITKVAYNAATRTLTLTHAAIKLTVPLQLTISGSGTTALKDNIGQAIDGDKNGTSGGDAIVSISKTNAGSF